MFGRSGDQGLARLVMALRAQAAGLPDQLPATSAAAQGFLAPFRSLAGDYRDRTAQLDAAPPSLAEFGPRMAQSMGQDLQAAGDVAGVAAAPILGLAAGNREAWIRALGRLFPPARGNASGETYNVPLAITRGPKDPRGVGGKL